MDESKKQQQIPIAICGYSYRLPGGLKDDDAVFEMLASRGYVQESVGDRYGPDEVPWDGFGGPERVASPYEGLLRDGAELEFDCAMFGISMHDAKRMDPQHKMMLSITWEALQKAGLSQTDLHNSNTGVFCGHQVSSIAAWHAPFGATSADVPGKAGSMIANRISFHFNWTGPSLSVATACSSGISALDVAIKSLRTGECEVAASGAVNYLGLREGSIGFNSLGIISKTGTSRSFDKDANGYMRSEGAFMFILKRLDDAERDGDNIFAVIRGCGLNTAGAEPDADQLTQGRMIVAPVQKAQEQLMEAVAQGAGVQPTDVSYVEAHATGTPVGDSVEGRSVSSVYGSQERLLRLSSVRSNMGHMEAASFPCSLLKVLIMMQRRTYLPVSSHFKSPNPKIPLGKEVAVQTECEPFSGDQPVLIGINSFGFGGANGHCLVQEYTSNQQWSTLSGALNPQKVFAVPLSAKSEDALVENARRLAKWIETPTDEDVDLFTLVANLSARTTHHSLRTSFTVSTLEELKTQLQDFVENDSRNISRVQLRSSIVDRPKVAMVFPGQGAQWAGCGKQLYESELVFRRVVDAVDGIWVQLAGCKLSEVAFDVEVGSKLHDCAWAQPVTFLIQVALFELFTVYGVSPDAVVGHSAGEVAAAYASGAFSLEEACRLVYIRSKLQNTMSGSGRMLVLMMDQATVESTLERLGFLGTSEEIEVACINSPSNTVVCGPEIAIMQLRAMLEKEGQPSGKLIQGNIAFHSRYMEPIREELITSLADLDGRASDIPFVSTVTGVQHARFDAGYWWRNVREPVNLLGAINTVRRRLNPDFMIEISPHITLRAPIRECHNSIGKPFDGYIHSLIRRHDASEQFAESIGRCFEAGIPINFKAFYPRPRPITHALPIYAMKKDHMIDSLLDESFLLKEGKFCAGPLLGKHLQGDRMQYQTIVSKQHYPWMTDHVVQETALFPAAGYIELLLEAFRGTPIRIEDARFTESTLHCVGTLVKLEDAQALERSIPVAVPRDLASIVKESQSTTIYSSKEDFYTTLSARYPDKTFAYGPYFQVIKNVERDLKSNGLKVELEIDQDKFANWERMGYIFHPSLLDGALQIFIAYLMEATDFTGVPQSMLDFVLVRQPTSSRIICYYEPPPYLRGNIHILGQLAFGEGERSAGTIMLYDAATGELIAYLGEYVTFTARKNKARNRSRSKHILSWQPKDLSCCAKNVAAVAIELITKGEKGTRVLEQLIIDLVSKGHPQQRAPFFANVGEWITDAEEVEAFLEHCVDTIANRPVQYTIISESTTFLKEMYKKYGFSNKDAHLRFVEPCGVRPGMFELLVVRGREPHFEKITSFVAPGGFLLTEGEQVPSDWTCMSSERSEDMRLWQAPKMKHAEVPSAGQDAVIVNDEQGFAKRWRQVVKKDYSEPFDGSQIDFSGALKWNRVDFFAMCDEETACLFEGPQKLTEWVNKFAAHREMRATTPCLFTVFTSGAMGRSVTSPAQSGIWGAVRTMAAELGESCNVDFRLVDLEKPDDVLYTTSVEMLREREVCIHNGQVQTSRLINVRQEIAITNLKANDSSYRLETTNSGALSDLHFTTYIQPNLGPQDIEVSVKATGLNFRDIMVGLSRLPLMSYEKSMLGRNIGIECSGIVSKCGKEVEKYKVGDHVVAMHGGCIANRIQCHQLSAVKMPNNFSFEQGSALFSVYMTAYYSLIHLARVRKRHTVLIHSAMGGVGQAAIAISKMQGACIYATAGSESKRQSLLEMGCVDAFDSHSSSWYFDLLNATGGKGVDVILNSLAGYHVDLCLKALSAGGRHCEIGKVDIYSDRPLKLASFRKNISYHAVDIDRMMLDDPELVAELAGECLALLRDGKLPALPIRVFAQEDYQDAMRCMMNGHHTGKLVLTTPALDRDVSVVDTRPVFGRNTVLLSGCFGDFGLRLLSYVIALGAQNILVLDRDPERKRSVEWLRHQSYIGNSIADSCDDLRIEIVSCDVTNYDDVVNTIDSVTKLKLPPIGSVFHLAGVLDDKQIADVDKKSFGKVFGPKASGALNLHLATLECTEIQHFVMFSSTSSVFGNPGQVAYSAANSYLDGLAELRRNMEMPALSFCMGAVVEAGMAARNPKLLSMMQRSGMPAISCITAIEALDWALRDGSQGNLVVTVPANLKADMTSTDFLRSAAQLVDNSSAFTLLEGQKTLSKEALAGVVAERIAAVCGVDNVGEKEPLSTYGLNSISVAEICTFLSHDFSLNVSPIKLMTSETVESITMSILWSQSSTSDVDEIRGEGAKRVVEEQKDEIWSHTRPSLRVSRFGPQLTDKLCVGPFQKKTLSFATNTKTDPAPANEMPAKVLNGRKECAEAEHNLPGPCAEVLDEMMAFLDSLDTKNLCPVVSVTNLRKIMLTGSTGFLGRHFLSDLLEFDEVKLETVYCPVRAKDDGVALDRVINSMKEAGTWKDSYRSRIYAFASDLSDVNFRVSDALQRELFDEVDAVYHFASNVSLAASFQEVRSTNCAFVRPVLRLCLTTRRKHLFLASTLGIFPEYFCQFGHDMTGRDIRCNAMPDSTVMRKIFPLAIAGYSWSKFLVELVCQKAERVAALPLAVFRLPYVYWHSRTGFTVTDNPTVRLLQAALQTKMVPGDNILTSCEDANICNEIMLRISMNPQRRHTIYHCTRRSSPVPSDCMVLDLLGLPCRRTDYKSFRAKCRELHSGKDSLLRSYWPLMDHYSKHWFTTTGLPPNFLIDDTTIREDCHPFPNLPNLMATFRASLDWCFANPESSLPFDVNLLHAALDIDTIIRPARELCDKYGFNFDKVMPAQFIEGLQRLCEEISDAHLLQSSARHNIAFVLASRVESRVHLYRLLQKYPDIADEPIEKPMFILGLNRTGSTFLHRMIEASGKFATVHLEEQLFLATAEESAIPGKDQSQRLVFLESLINDGKGELGALKGIHEVGLHIAEEDMCAHAHSFMSLEYDVMFDLPLYRCWLDSQCFDDVYQEHRTWMQYISWARRRSGEESRRWCFKLPWHARSLPSLLKYYPDAKLVHTHRELEQVVSSWCSLVERQRERSYSEVDKDKLGADQLEVLTKTLASSTKFRRDNPQLQDRWLDVTFSSVKDSPVEVANQVIAHAGMEIDDVSTMQITNYAQRSKEQGSTKVHHHHLSDYGLSKEHVASAMSSLPCPIESLK